MAKAGRQRGRRPHRDAAKSSVLKMSSVRRTPNVGISQSTGRNDPRILPVVEIAYNDPLVRPLCPTSLVTSRIANGDTRPSKVTGMAKRRIVPRRELKKILTETCSSPVTDQARTRSLINGSSAVESAATAVMTQRTCADG